jgi:chromatin segregation and condensation protein Rec8/ScpA/Scc1 (kleisin family)
VPLSYVVQLLKFAFNYQVYDVFETCMEPISELVERAGGQQTSLLALLQILYEIEQGEKERKVVQTIKNHPMGKTTKGTDKKKQRAKSPGKSKDVRHKSPVIKKMKFKRTKAIQDLLDAAKGKRTLTKRNVHVRIDASTNKDTHDDQQSLEEALEDLCALLLADPQIVRHFLVDFHVSRELALVSFVFLVVLIARQNRVGRIS